MASSPPLLGVSYLMATERSEAIARTGTAASGLRPWPDAALTVVAMALVAIAHAASGASGAALDVIATGFLVPLVLVDLRIRRLPDALTLGGTATLLALLAIGGALSGDLDALSGGVAGAALMSAALLVLHLISPAGLGFGDVKLGLLLGVPVGARSPGLVLTALFVAGLAGSVAGVVLMVRQRRRHLTIAFGPFLVLGAAVAVVLG